MKKGKENETWRDCIHFYFTSHPTFSYYSECNGEEEKTWRRKNRRIGRGSHPRIKRHLHALFCNICIAVAYDFSYYMQILVLLR